MDRTKGDHTTKPRNVPLSMPPLTADEKARQSELLRWMQAETEHMRQRNLNAAVQLAVQAARGQGPLVEHFAELGRRFGDEIGKVQPRAPGPILRVVEGGREPAQCPGDRP